MYRYRTCSLSVWVGVGGTGSGNMFRILFVPVAAVCSGTDPIRIKQFVLEWIWSSSSNTVCSVTDLIWIRQNFANPTLSQIRNADLNTIEVVASLLLYTVQYVLYEYAETKTIFQKNIIVKPCKMCSVPSVSWDVFMFYIKRLKAVINLSRIVEYCIVVACYPTVSQVNIVYKFIQLTV